MQELHILKAISGKTVHVSFHTPGHKGDAAYGVRFPAARTDLTELSYTDDLSSPAGAILQAQRDIAEIVGAERSYITTDGSSSGVMAMIYAAADRGKKLIIQRNSHKSVWNACRLMRIEPVIVQGEMVKGVMQPPSPQEIERLVCADEDIIGAVITSPDYYGNIAPLSEYSRILKAHNKLLITDGAHGGHLAFEKDRQGYAGVYSDLWVDGVHKSMPALTQGAIVQLNDLTLKDRLEEGLNIFRTTSPSYPIMASVEYSVKYCSAYTGEIAKVKDLADGARARIREYGYGVYPSADWTKLCVDLAPFDMDGELTCRRLEACGIYAEFTDGRYILFYLSPMTAASHVKRLLSALVAAAQNGKLKTKAPRPEIAFGESGCGYLEALEAPFEYIPLELAAGRISAANAGVSPPCIPLVAAGEIITPQVIEVLEKSAHAFATDGGKIKVVKN